MQSARGIVRLPDRTEWILFLTLFVSYAWFHQGGGWQQNSRFDQVRSLAEAGELRINDYLLYRPVVLGGEVEIRRVPLPDPVVSLESLSAPNTRDLSLRGGSVYPNKAPGVSLLATPAYAAVSRLGAGWGGDPDAWRALTLNAHLTTALFVGLLGAFGCLVFSRTSRALFPEIPASRHVAATWTFGLGTMVFPFSTLLFDHVPVAVFLLAAFGLLVRARGLTDGEGRRRSILFAVSGLVAGLAVACNYSAALALPLIAAYALSVGGPRALLPFVAGGVAPAVGLGAYHGVCFGGPFSIPYAYQAETFRTGSGWLGVFSLPDPVVAGKLLFSAHRGLFFTSPVLLLSALGLWQMSRNRETRHEAWLCAAIVVVFLGVNAAFDRWHGGFTFGPRYLIPALPFLALGLAPAFQKLPRATAALAGVSGALMLLATAVNPQVPNPEKNPVAYLLRHFGGELPQGPVSTNDLGVYEGRLYSIYALGSERVQWNAYNLGELVWPRSRASLLPLLVVMGAGVAASLRPRNAYERAPADREAA
jgi:hypothetical protein